LPEKIRLRRKTFRVRLDLEARLDRPAQNAPSAANFLQSSCVSFLGGECLSQRNRSKSRLGPSIAWFYTRETRARMMRSSIACAAAFVEYGFKIPALWHEAMARSSMAIFGSRPAANGDSQSQGLY
jgi:hypothetical protein